MQVSELYRDELRAIYRQRVAESFALAGTCLRKARIARLSGDYTGRRRWLRHAHVLWMAGAGWRLRAEGEAP